MAVSRDSIQREALAAASRYKRCGLGVTMGGGKTLIGLKHMAAQYEPGDRFLVVAPKRTIFDAWVQTAENFGLEHLLQYISFSTYISLSRQPLDFKTIYLDECHSLLFSHEAWLEQYDGAILGLTGTPPRFSASEKGRMVERFCPIVFAYFTDEAIADGILNDYTLIVHHLKLDVRKTVRIKNPKTGGTWHTSEWECYRYWDERVESSIQNAAAKELEWLRLQRMRVLMNFPSKVIYARKLLAQTDNKIIVFANTQQQAEEICVHSYHSANKRSRENLELFIQGDIRCLSSVAQLNEGVNIPHLKEGIILHAFSNERKTAQRIGRLLRLNPDDKATAHILCYDGSIDEHWVHAAMQDFDAEKILHYYPWKRESYNHYGQKIPAPFRN